MKHLIISISLLCAASLYAQEEPKSAEVPKAPELSFHVVQDFLKIPRDMIFVGSVGRVFKYDLSGKRLGEFGKLGRLPGWVRLRSRAGLPG